MAEHRATIAWQNRGPDFSKGQYSREHTWTFDGGATVPASPSPAVVPSPWSNPAGVDPEEAFVAAIASCHMLTFLHKAREAGFVVARYVDDAEGVMEEIGGGRMAVTRVTLRPQITYEGRSPTPAERDRLHHGAHEECFIANSVKTEVVVQEQEAA